MKPLLSVLAALMTVLPVCASDPTTKVSRNGAIQGPAASTIIVNNAELSDSGCDAILPVGQRPLGLRRARELFAAVKKLDLKYGAINDCCWPRALRIAEIARRRGYQFSLAYNLAGGISYKSQLKSQGWTDDAIRKEMGLLYDWNTTLLPNIDKFYVWHTGFSGWVYHVAPLARVTIAPGRTCDMIFDPALFSEPVPLKRWTDFQRDARSKLHIVPGTDFCIPWQNPATCKKPDIDKELLTCAAVEENSVTHEEELIGQWQSSDPAGRTLRITKDGAFSLTEGGRLLLSGLLQHSVTDLEVGLLVFEIHEPVQQSYPRLTGGQVSRLPFSMMKVNDTHFLELFFNGKDSPAATFTKDSKRQP